MAKSTIKSNYSRNYTNLWNSAGKTQYSPTIPTLANYNTILIMYNVGKTVLWIPFSILKIIGNIKSSSDGENFVEIEYVSDTSLNVKTTQGSLVSLYGVNI